MIVDKINIPLDKQRIIFGAKQLVDDSKVTDYGKDFVYCVVKESGMTVHLIARIGGQETTSQPINNSQNDSTQQNTTQQQTTSNNQGSQQTQPPTNEQNMNNPFGNLFRGMGLGGNMPQTTAVTFSNMGDLNSSLGGILGSLGIRLPQQPTTQPQQRPAQQQNVNSNPYQTPPTNTQRQTQQPQQATSSFNINQPQQQQATSSNQPQQNTQFQVSNEPILRLNETITTLNLPAEPVLSNQHLSLR